ncbi:AaceriAGL168Wp [[Ashbya] aceris (nom. inval.)]|nr:AaceriAGL168Wp [[Ashbya] aceris (nom. inval.)]
MTTSHRPQLEARSGAKSGVAGEYVPTGVEHARLLPGHRTVKRRREGGVAEAEEAGKVEEAGKAGAETGAVDGVDGTGNLAAQGRGTGCEDGDEVSSADDGSDADDEDDAEDAEELRRELEALRASKASKAGSGGAAGAGGSSWRAGAVFGRHKRRREQTEGRAYRNDVTQSEYHKDFLRRLTK